MYNSLTGMETPEPKDIVDRLRKADRRERTSLDGAMIIGDFPSKSLWLEAAEEIEKLRRIVGITGN